MLAVSDRKPRDRGFLSDDDIRNDTKDGAPRFRIKVRLPSYRALPLSCIGGIELRIDGQQVPPDRIGFCLGALELALDDLGDRSDVWWWVLDTAELVVSGSHLVKGVHSVEGRLTTVEPYITAGRFSFFHTSSKKLKVAS